jgi:hypothetical protein
MPEEKGVIGAARVRLRQLRICMDRRQHWPLPAEPANCRLTQQSPSRYHTRSLSSTLRYKMSHTHTHIQLGVCVQTCSCESDHRRRRQSAIVWICERGVCNRSLIRWKVECADQQGGAIVAAQKFEPSELNFQQTCQSQQAAGTRASSSFRKQNMSPSDGPRELLCCVPPFIS